MLLWADGFDHYGSDAALQGNYSWAYNGPYLTNNPDLVRTGGYAMQQLVADNRYWWYKLGAARTTLYASLAIYLSSYPNNDASISFGFASDNNDPTGNIQVRIGIDVDGSVVLYRGKYTEVLGRSDPGIVPAIGFTSFQMRATIDPVNGAVEVYVNGKANPVIAVAGVSTQGTGNTDIVSVFAAACDQYASNYPGTLAYDDFVIWDDTTPYMNSFFGDPRCRTTFASANGGMQDFVSESGGPAYAEIDRVPAVPDTNYIHGDVVGNISNFVLTPLPTNTSFIASVFIVAQANKSDGGVCGIDVTLNSAGVLSAPLSINPGTVPGYFTGCVAVDPNTGIPFTVGNFNLALGQVERSA